MNVSKLSVRISFAANSPPIRHSSRELATSGRGGFVGFWQEASPIFEGGFNTGRLFGLCFYIDRFCKEAQLFVSGFLFVQGQSKKFGCFFLSQQFCKSLHRAVTSHLIVFDTLGRRDDPGIHYLSRRILCDPFLAQYYFHATFPSLRSWEEGRRSPNSHTAAILEKFLLDHPTVERPKK
jgi:hypothetical protein